jgi:four helix bundle protein
MQFLSMARGSVFEVEAQLLLCQELGLGHEALRRVCQGLCDEISRLLYTSLRGLRDSGATDAP